MVPVTFKRSWSNYNAGEVAGFSPDVAQSLVEAGIASYAKRADNKPTETPEQPKRQNFAPTPELTKSKVARMDAPHLVLLAAENGIELDGKELKKDTLPIILKAMFPDEGDDDAQE